MVEKLYLFNPFRIKDAETEELQLTYEKMQGAIDGGAETPFQIAKNIELYANMSFIVVEMIARYTECVNLTKARINSLEAREVYVQRRAWVEMNEDKPPAMSYFEALARDKLSADYVELARMESNLKRFKGAYDSIEAKQNALKKVIDGIKYET